MTLALTSKSKHQKAAPGQRRGKRKSVQLQSGINAGAKWKAFTVMPTIQPKLKIGEPNDKFEQEADRVADEVMRMPNSTVIGTSGLNEAGQSSCQSPGTTPPFLQRQCSECAAEDETRLQRSPLPSSVKHPKISALNGSLTAQFKVPSLLGSELEKPMPVAISEQTAFPQIQRLCPKCEKDLQRQPVEDEEEELLQTKEMPDGTHQVSSNQLSQLDAIRGGGQPLPKSVRSFFEPRFEQDFSHVRMHTGSKAAESAGALNARAYTIGQHIVFGKGQYAPETAEGKRLLAHELVHTVQQGKTNHSTKIQRVCDPPNVAATVGTRAGCTDNFDGTFVPSPNLFRFNVNCDDFAPTQQAALIGFASGLPPSTTFEIHGFASVDGPPDFNQNLGCARALKARSVLTSPSPGGAGIAAARITRVVNHGPVPGPAADRRSVTILTSTPPVPETITSETVATSPGARTRTKIGVGEEVRLTHAPGSATWSTTVGTTPLSATNGVTVIFTAPDTAPATTQRITVTAGAATISFDVLAPTSVAMDREPGTGVKHTVNQPDSGIALRTFLGPDTVNFSRVRVRELDVAGVATPGVYSCNPSSGGHCGAGGGGAPCPDFPLSDIVVAGKGTKDLPPPDCAYSGHCGTAPPFVPGSVTLNIPYEYQVGAGAFNRFTTVTQVHTLLPFSILSTSKAGAIGITTVTAPTVVIPQCP